MEASEHTLLAATVRESLEHAEDADAALARIGWSEMLTAEPRDATEIVFETLGATNASATVLDDVLARALGADPGADRAVLLPRFGTWASPGRRTGDTVGADGVASGRVRSATELLVVCAGDGRRDLAKVPVAATSVTAAPGVDPDGGWHVVRVAHTADPGPTITPAEWDDAIAAGRRAIAHEIAGACRTMLTLATTHAADRVQFGRPVARFQAVRHRLAEALVALAALDAALVAAWDEPTAATAALAKAVAGRTARTVTDHCQQVLAGIGFTTDHPFHRFLRRVMALDGILGTADDLTLDLGRRLIADGSVPTLIEL